MFRPQEMNHFLFSVGNVAFMPHRMAHPRELNNIIQSQTVEDKSFLSFQSKCDHKKVQKQSTNK